MGISGAIIQRPQKRPQAAELRHPRWSGSSLCAIRRAASRPGGLWPGCPCGAGHSRQEEERDPSLQAGGKSTQLCGLEGEYRLRGPHEASLSAAGPVQGGAQLSLPPPPTPQQGLDDGPSRACTVQDVPGRGPDSFSCLSFRPDNPKLSCTHSADVQIEAYPQWLAFLDRSQALCSLPLQVQSPRVPIVPYREELFPV